MSGTPLVEEWSRYPVHNVYIYIIYMYIYICIYIYGGKSVGEKSLGENRGKWDAGFRSPFSGFFHNSLCAPAPQIQQPRFAQPFAKPQRAEPSCSLKAHCGHKINHETLLLKLETILYFVFISNLALWIGLFLVWNKKYMGCIASVSWIHDADGYPNLMIARKLLRKGKAAAEISAP